MDAITSEASGLASLSIDSGSASRLAKAKSQLQGAESSAGPGGSSADKTRQLREACTEFEAIFLKQMLDSMRKTVDKSNDLIQPTMADGIFEDMLYEQYSKLMAKTGHFGIADMLYNQFTQKTVAPDP